ncbi:MAG: ornithine carbamoyltransferase [Myxococcota bacterium]
MTVRHLLTLEDLSPAELATLLERAAALRTLRGDAAHPRPLAGRSVAVVLEKASTRTRLSFEVGIHELGGQALTVMAQQTQMGRGEPIEDTGRMLSGFVHGVVYRTYAQARLEALAGSCSVPVINGLTDTFHPCQLLADLMTVRDAFGEVAGRPVAWIGDGNNMAHSWILAAGLAGFPLRLACPAGYEPEAAVLARGEALGADVKVVRDDAEAAEGAAVVTTDVWASMGQEEEQAEREKAFAGYQVDAALMGRAREDAIFLHCLPAHRGEEVSAEVIDGPWSRVFPEAENRLHAQKALLELLLGA